MKTLTVTLQLHDILRDQRGELSEELIRRLRATSAEHYRDMPESALQSRVMDLIDTFTRSITARPSLFADYLESITLSRIKEGIGLHEIQAILQILEDMIWCRVIDHIPADKQVRCLSRITVTVGMAKDRLARIYLDHLEKSERSVAYLQRRLEAMVKGTDSGPIGEEDLP